MFKNVMKETASRRALAAIINTLDVEIISRRDTYTNSRERAELRMFMVAHKGFMQAWNTLNADTDPVSYAVAWDAHLSSMVFNKHRIESLVHHHVRTILAEVAVDIEALLPVSNIENIRSGEKALAEIVNLDQNVVLAR